MLKQNKLIIAAAGSGKTGHLVQEALEQRGNILITTYTRANEAEIRKKIIEKNKCIPPNVTIQTWFSFLLQHGVKPFQGCIFDRKIEGFILVNSQSGLKGYTRDKKPIYFAEEADFQKYYFSNSFKIYSDKLSKFIVRCNAKSDGSVIDRISRIYSHIFIDEVQDLAGYDLEILKLLFDCNSSILLVGDPRQVTYLTHHERKYSDYKDGKIKKFVEEKCVGQNCIVDEVSLKYSHRNNAEICSFSSKLYPNEPISEACECKICREYKSIHNGIFLVKSSQLQGYLNDYSPIILRDKNSVFPEWNFGKSKGLGFERVLIYPTKTIIQYLKDGKLSKVANGKPKQTFDIAKFYVAITRARYSVGIVYEYNDDENFIGGVQKL